MQSGERNRRQSIAIEIIAMSAYHWLIIFLPFLFVCGVALRCRRYVRSVADFLVAGRCAGRYVMQSGSIMGPLSVMTLVATSEIQTQVGYGVQFWNSILMPLGSCWGFSDGLATASARLEP